MFKKILIATLLFAGGVAYGQGTITNTGLADSPIFLSPVTIGVDDAGYDLKVFGATSGNYMLWDESADDLLLVGSAADLDVDGTANFDAVDIDGAVQLDAIFTSGVDGTGYDFKLFGATASAYVLWDESADDLKLVGNAGFTMDPQTMTAATDGGAGSTVLPGMRVVNVTGAGSANDWILLPVLSSVPFGHQIYVIAAASGNFEIRTPASSNETINGTDADGDSTEFLAIDGEILVFTKLSTTGWYSYGLLPAGIIDATGNLVD